MDTIKQLVRVWVALSLLLTSCSIAEPQCPIESLILDENLLPEGTQAERLISPISEKPNESAARSFYYAPYDIFHAVINWHSTRSAKREFDNDIVTAFDTDKYMGPWETPSKIYSSLIADNYHVACGRVHDVYQCRLAATYRDYSVYFRTDVDGEVITLMKVNEILQGIDAMMAQCVD